MTPAEQRAELLAAVDAARRSRDAHRAAAQADDETVMLLERVLNATAAITPVLREPERPEWVSAMEAARRRGVTKGAITGFCRRAHRRGDHHIVRPVGGRWQVRIDLLAPTAKERRS